jgi:hypothetical protein
VDGREKSSTIENGSKREKGSSMVSGRGRGKVVPLKVEVKGRKEVQL